jgi:hypothetical protein
VSVSVFISCVSNEFRAYRDQLRHDLTRHNVEVKVQEDFKDLGFGILDELDTCIAACDAVVHLVGDMTGAAPKPAAVQAMLDSHPGLTARFPPLREALERGEDISYTHPVGGVACAPSRQAAADRESRRGRAARTGAGICADGGVARGATGAYLRFEPLHTLEDREPSCIPWPPGHSAFTGVCERAMPGDTAKSHRCSSAIRLDVSQRLPPIFWTSE